MKAKDQSVLGLTKGVEFLFKKNGVEYVKGTGTFADEHTIKVALNDGGETTVVAKKHRDRHGQRGDSLPRAGDRREARHHQHGSAGPGQDPGSMVVIGGGIIGLEMGSVWSRLGTKVTVVEFLDQIGGPGMDAEVSKAIQKLLKKQGLDFKLGTKVLGGDATGDKIKLELDSAKGGKPQSVSIHPSIHPFLSNSNSPASGKKDSETKFLSCSRVFLDRGRCCPRGHWPPSLQRRGWASSTSAWSWTSGDESSSIPSTEPRSPTSAASET